MINNEMVRTLYRVLLYIVMTRIMIEVAKAMHELINSDPRLRELAEKLGHDVVYDEYDALAEYYEHTDNIDGDT